MGANPAERISFKHLGTAAPHKKRPLLIVVRNREQRDVVLRNTKKLKDAGDSYSRIYVKKDQHPAVRKEWKRLFDAEKAEKEKAENQGANIRLDTRERKLYRNDEVIDSWQPHPF